MVKCQICLDKECGTARIYDKDFDLGRTEGTKVCSECFRLWCSGERWLLFKKKYDALMEGK